jgi:hypothetical protein
MNQPNMSSLQDLHQYIPTNFSLKLHKSYEWTLVKLGKLR